MLMTTRLFALALATCIHLTGWAQDWADSDFVVPVAAHQLKVMNYNVQNLFDADHDEGKDDFEFLPAESPLKKNCYGENGRKTSRTKYCLSTDWTEEKIALKLEQIKRVVDAQGELPDILTLQEVENPNIVGRLARHLGFDGFYMTDSPDKRGIDLAILYRKAKLEPLGFEEYELKNPINPTRNLSVGHFRLSKKLGGGVLAVYPNHWPSQATKTTKARLIPAEQLVEHIQKNRRKFKDTDYHVVVTGDFNTLAHEKPNPVEDVMLHPKTGLLDVRDLSDASLNPTKNIMPPASYYYAANDEWNEFDRILISDNLNDGEGLEVEPETFRIHAPKFLTKTNDAGELIPFRYNHNTTKKQWLGYSDHFAILVRFTFHQQ